MPKRLLDRRRRETINEYRAAARERIADGEALAASGRATSAIYLWGHAAEMALKACYFECIRFGSTQQITRLDRKHAEGRAVVLSTAKPAPANFHDLEFWAELLVAERRNQGRPFAVVANTVLLNSARRLSVLWSESLRYSSNKAYNYAVAQVRSMIQQIAALCQSK
jgi:hypothetical protein